MADDVYVQKVLLADKEIEESQVADFIFDCIAQLGGPRYVFQELPDELEKAAHFAKSIIYHFESRPESIDLKPLTSMDVKKLCEAIVGSLVGADDLGTLMGIDEDFATEVIARI